MKVRARALAFVLAGLAAAAILLTVIPGRRELLLAILVLGAAGVTTLVLLARTRAAFAEPEPSALERALRRAPRPPARLPELERIEGEVTLSLTTAFDLHARLRPILREIAEAGLAGRGLRLDGDEEAARAALGNDVWELVRPNRPPPADRHAPGPGLEALNGIVDDLEALRQ